MPPLPTAAAVKTVAEPQEGSGDLLDDSVLSAIGSVLLHALLLGLFSLIYILESGPGGPVVTEVVFDDEDGIAVPLEVSEVNVVQVTNEDLVLPPDTNPTQLLGAADSAVVSPRGLSAGEASDGEEGDGDPSLGTAEGEIQARVRAAGGQSGEVQLSLSWQDLNDLDLHVITPSGQRIFYRAKRSACRGELDVDMNATPQSETPVENVRWLRRAPPGRLTVIVHYYAQHARNRVSRFRLLVKLGEQRQIVEGSVGLGSQLSVHRFKYVRGSKAQQAAAIRQLTALQTREEQAATRMLNTALARPRPDERVFRRIVADYPHTDAALKALQLLDGAGKFSR